MRKALMMLMIVCLGMALTGCAYNSPVQGLYFTNATFPSGDKVKLDAETATKEGRSSCWSVLFLVAFGDCGIDEAMKNGQLNKAHHVDNQSFNFFFLAMKYETIVYGE